MKYQKPMIIINEELSEGVYTASGSTLPSKSQYNCKSIYMNGVYQQPTYNPIEDGYKLGRGCEGCPAWDGGLCRFINKPEEMNWDGDFRPTWEVQGKLPDEKGY